MIAAFGLVIAAGHLYICGLVIVLQVAVFRELVNVRYKKAKEKQVPLFRSLQWLWFGLAMMTTYGDWIRDLSVQDSDLKILRPLLRYHDWISFSLYSLAFMLSVLSLTKGIIKYQIGQLTWTLLSCFLVVFQMKGTLINICNGLFWFIFPVSLVVCNDIMAYFCGISMGKRFIRTQFLSLSPNKTWEGFIGGGLCTCVIAFFLAGFLSQFQYLVCPVVLLQTTPFTTAPSCHPAPVFLEQALEAVVPPELASWFPEGIEVAPVRLHAVALALFASIIAPFGGFFASAIKRAHDLKDFDSVIPGHGGAMDRVDCQFIMALCAHVYYVTFIGWESGSPLTVSMILSRAELMSEADLLALFDALRTLLQARGLLP